MEFVKSFALMLRSRDGWYGLRLCNCILYCDISVYCYIVNCKINWLIITEADKNNDNSRWFITLMQQLSQPLTGVVVGLESKAVLTQTTVHSWLLCSMVYSTVCTLQYVTIVTTKGRMIDTVITFQSSKILHHNIINLLCSFLASDKHSDLWICLSNWTSWIIFNCLISSWINMLHSPLHFVNTGQLLVSTPTNALERKTHKRNLWS